jgi:hypothetical protein
MKLDFKKQQNKVAFMVNLLELYCSVDDFMKEFMPAYKKHLLTVGNKQRDRESRLSVSEIITVLIFFHYAHYRNFKAYYTKYVSIQLRTDFPNLVSYKQFVALIKSVLVPLTAYINHFKKHFEGIGFVDSTAIAVCFRKRISSHQVFSGLAGLGKSSKGWFLGFKLHFICDTQGQFLSCHITPGNIDDRKPLLKLTQFFKGKLVGDKGYISKTLAEQLLNQGVQLITGIKRNMKNKLVPLADKILLRKRVLIESVFNQLKNTFHLEHSRHRHPINGLVNILSTLAAYIHYPNKPSISMT